MILKAGDKYMREVYISLLRAWKCTVSFGNKPWSEYLKLFYSYMSLKHTMNTYLLPLLSFSLVMTGNEIFSQ